MAPKRKAGAVGGITKAGRPSKGSTPGPATPRSLASDSSDVSDNEADVEIPEEMRKSMVKFDTSSDEHRYSMGRGVHDMASRHFDSSRDFTALRPKHDAHNRPLWIQGNFVIVLESFHQLAPQAQDFLVTVAEPVSRPQFLHEYKLTTHSLYAAVSVGLNPKDIISTLERFSKTPVPSNVKGFISACGRSYGKVKLVLRNTKYLLETTDPEVLQMLLKDPDISACRVHGAEQITTSAPKMSGLAIAGTKEAAGIREAEGLNTAEQAAANPSEKEVYAALNDDDDDDDQEVVHAFQIRDDAVETVTKRCQELQYPALEEYDFRNDNINANLEIDLQPSTQIRPYQEKSLSKMFGNGRAKSGIIVLPCGAGKTLVGITAACTIKKGVIVLATSNMSVIQWRNEFIKWSNINPDDVAIFSSDHKETFSGNTGVIVTTYSMVTATQKRSHESSKMMDFLRKREWGLMLLDEVHVVPANMFRKVIGNIKAHSKLGLTATLLREDDKIEDLNFLIGPKLYEANWMELSQQGHIARVQCAEVWCPMPTEFYDEYLKAATRSRSLLYVMNPLKMQACQYLITYHESRGDKIIVFSDDVYALEFYARKLMKPYLYGGTSNAERQEILQRFRDSSECNTIFLSKIGDTSLDLPEATCLIQISAQYGSRRQEAQRLGRILRAKRRNDEGFNAFFYSLVSKDTQEMLFSSKRQAFLVDQGYAFKVITTLHNIEKTPNLCFATAQERRELLLGLLDDMEKNKSQAEPNKMVRRGAHLLADLSGGQDMAYVEQNKPARGKKKVAHSDFFKKQQRDKDRRKKLVNE
ncbi:DNA repair helicase RAD25 [Cryphonectria parasitica EP155]|uniref:DNA 3'-5' helicase n=1 Tax=Cryphonectria parasitica (strain ATCC 38755 / EP155) TaxID=660469 RepID=A0A9P4YCI0_CRYP1|nr:DNA repair helicase RAD25 [Cryphonectria parasitica EP155]KAF3770474.1 DNA repair helicase RAD25 [Cryphonectria parasitica EP155]